MFPHRFPALLFALILVVTGCSSGAGGGGGSDDTGTTTSTVSGNLETINEDFTPNSLALEGGAGSLVVKRQEEGGDPCADADDLYDCQATLLRLYLDMARDFVSMTQTVVEEIGTALGDLPDGSAGTVTEGAQTIHYSKTSATRFSILIEESAPAAYFDINEGTYTLRFDLDNFSDSEGNAGQLDTTVSFTDDENWSVVLFLAGMDCDDSDPRAPERIHIRVTRAGTLWTGKAMFYSGRWLADPVSCDLEEEDDTSMNFYTDFIANDTAARASVYMMSRTKDDLSDIEDFGMDQLGDNFSIPDDTTPYVNPFCNPATTLDALWGDDCSSLDTALAAADYGPATDWILPSEFYLLDVTIPSSL